MIDRRNFLATLAGSVEALAVPDWASDVARTLESQDAQPTTLVLVRKNASGEVILRYVRGSTLHRGGSYVWRDIPVNLPRQLESDPNQLSQPTVLRHADSGRTYVARATFVSSTGQTAIHVVGAIHPTILAESQQSTFARPVIISSPLVLSHFNYADAYAATLLLVWQEGTVLQCATSTDGATWSAPRTLTHLAGGERFAIWSEGTKLYLARTVNHRQGISVRESLDTIHWVVSTTIPALFRGPPVNLVGSVSALSVATDADYFYLAFGDTVRLQIARVHKGSGELTLSTVRTLGNSPPQQRFHGVTVHPSPYGWALQYVKSFSDINSPSGRRYLTFGQRSNDGLDYSGTQWIYARDTQHYGSTSMTTTALPMPWILKTHDSGRPTESVYNFLITADGFTSGERDRLADLCRQMTTNIVNRAPFFYNQSLFNVWAVITYSQHSGLSSPAEPKKTIFGGHRNEQLPVAVDTIYDGIAHARLLLTGSRTTPHCYGWVMFNEPVASYYDDFDGVNLSGDSTRSKVPIHEYLHTNQGGFRLGDHERHFSQLMNNKSFDRTLAPAGNHGWQTWFVFDGTAPSRLIEVTDAYRNGLESYVAAGGNANAYHRNVFPFEANDPTSPHYVDALSLFQVGLWESELMDNYEFGLPIPRQYAPTRACHMYSLLHPSEILCPICSQTIVQHLYSVAGLTFNQAGFQGARGAFLEFQIKNQKVCPPPSPNPPTPPPRLTLEGLTVINGVPIPGREYSGYVSSDSIIARVNLGPWITSGTAARLQFRQRSTGESYLWIPSIQVLNSRGARYAIQPVDRLLPSGMSLIARLHQKHAPECDYEYWNLNEGDLVLTFTPH